jgi:hypothetical protein
MQWQVPERQHFIPACVLVVSNAVGCVTGVTMGICCVPGCNSTLIQADTVLPKHGVKACYVHDDSLKRAAICQSPELAIQVAV